MKIISVLLLFSFALPAHTAEILRFHPNIQNEALAEEAIELLHCLSEKSGSSWEFNGNAGGTHRLELREESHQLRGKYHKEGESHSVELLQGSASSVCAKIYPALVPSADLEEPLLPDHEPETRAKFPWKFAGAAAAVLGAFLLWKASRGPEHRSFRME
jgi:hypothetical protein